MAATILCVSCSGQKLGAAYYEETTAEVKLLHDTAEDTNYFLLKSCKHFLYRGSFWVCFDKINYISISQTELYFSLQ